MTDEACLYVAMRAPKEAHDRLLLGAVAPVVRQIRTDPDLDSFFFVRYDVPEWELRFRVLGRSAWIGGPLRQRVEAAIEPFVVDGTVAGLRFGEYLREVERYGGEEGMRLAERIFLHDSAACLDLLDAEARGALARSRREYSLVHTEHFLDLLGFDRDRRIEFYRFGPARAFEEGTWSSADVPRLEERYAAVRDGLRELLRGASSREPVRQYGGEEAAAIARSCLAATRPTVEDLLRAHAAGRVRQDLVRLAWSYAHLHCNRLGIDLVPEAILRYLMLRFYEEGC